ncbi:MAG TPA: phosphatase PAP2 family protein [Candidatus Acidoferrales bacterium]|nr:phosphatase PAP2 family protein [Candidatus Acidoferrales bacterium]
MALSKSDTGFWPVDKVILAYFAFAIAIVLGWWASLPDGPALLAAHVIGGALLVYQVKRPNPTSWIFRNWYPLPYVASCYKEMALFIPAVRSSDADRWLANLDYQLWGANPTVWMERIYHPVLTELLQWVYTLFVPAVLWVAWLLWRKARVAEFQYYAFLIALGFLASYIGYLIVPARGPRFLLKDLQHVPLQGLWLFQSMQSTLDRLESAHYDCFPSGHTELTILAWWGSRMVYRRWFRLYFAYTPCIIFATVYLRYHYTVDLLAGAATALTLILTAPMLYRKLSEGA